MKEANDQDAAATVPTCNQTENHERNTNAKQTYKQTIKN